MKPQVPDALVKQVEQAIANGTPLPPGVQVVPTGSPMPPGAVELPNIGIGKPLKKEPMPPLAPNDNLVKDLRARTMCPITKESQTLDAVLKQLLNLPPGSVETAEKRMNILSAGISAALLVPAYCAHQLKTRPICKLEDNADVKEINDTLATLEKRGTELDTELQQIISEAQKLMAKRWDLLVKSYGLSPVTYSYLLDDTDKQLSEVSLDCTSCQGLTRIRKSRQAIQENLSHQPDPTSVEKQ